MQLGNKNKAISQIISGKFYFRPRLTLNLKTNSITSQLEKGLNLIIKLQFKVLLIIETKKPEINFKFLKYNQSEK